MHTVSLYAWQHDHTFNQDRVKPGERKTMIVIILTATMMVAEIVSGILFGSMALLADGLHMATHAGALTIAALAYIYARRHARDHRYTFGTGKVNALAGFASAILLAIFTLMMVWESTERIINPISIAFNQAIAVAVVGLAINAVSAIILANPRQAQHNRDHTHHSHEHHTHSHQDHNLRSAYFHVLADAVTSLLAIVALLGGKYLGFVQMDPIMGVVGAILVANWSWRLLRDTSRVLLDRQGSEDLEQTVQRAIESHDDNRISDLHIWSIGPGISASSISLVTANPKDPDYYRHLIPEDSGIVHSIIEVNRCRDR